MLQIHTSKGINCFEIEHVLALSAITTSGLNHRVFLVVW